MTRFVLALLLITVLGPALAGGREPPMLLIEGTSIDSGVHQRFRLLASPNGQFRWDVDGPLGRTTSFDGQRLWESEKGSAAAVLPLFLEEVARIQTYFLTGLWSLDSGPFERVDGAGRRLKLRDGLLTSLVEVDEESGRPVTLTIEEAAMGFSIRFDSYREEAGGGVPSRMTTTDAGDLRTVIVERVSEVSSEGIEFGRPSTASENVRFDDQHDGVVEVKRASSGHLFVRPVIDDVDVGWFLFDTGAGISVITRDVADRVGMESIGETTVLGVGGHGGAAALRTGGAFELGPIRIDGLVFTERPDMKMGTRILGETVVGAIGWDVLLRSVVRIDPWEPAIRILAPDDVDVDDAAWRPVVLHYRVPYVHARFEGDREGLFCIDTGAGGLGALFHSEAVERLALLDGRETLARSMEGAGGEFTTRSGLIDWFEVAGHRTADVPALFNVGEDGEADPYSLGFVGAAVLEPFELVFDYAGGRVGFVPRTP